MTGADAWLLSLICESTDARIGAVLAADEVSVEQWRALEYLAHGGPCTMSALGTVTTVSGASLTRLVDQLVERGLVYRDADANDRRRVLVHLSSRGRRKVRRLRPKVHEAEAEAMSGLTGDEREQLARLLRRMAPDLAARLPHSSSG